jgi:hypothetical protein
MLDELTVTMQMLQVVALVTNEDTWQRFSRSAKSLLCISSRKAACNQYKNNKAF